MCRISASPSAVGRQRSQYRLQRPVSDRRYDRPCREGVARLPRACYISSSAQEWCQSSLIPLARSWPPFGGSQQRRPASIVRCVNVGADVLVQQQVHNGLVTIRGSQRQRFFDLGNRRIRRRHLSPVTAGLQRLALPSPGCHRQKRASLFVSRSDFRTLIK